MHALDKVVVRGCRIKTLFETFQTGSAESQNTGKKFFRASSFILEIVRDAEDYPEDWLCNILSLYQFRESAFIKLSILISVCIH